MLIRNDGTWSYYPWIGEHRHRLSDNPHAAGHCPIQEPTSKIQTIYHKSKLLFIQYKKYVNTHWQSYGQVVQKLLWIFKEKSNDFIHNIRVTLILKLLNLRELIIQKPLNLHQEKNNPLLKIQKGVLIEWNSEHPHQN